MKGICALMFVFLAVLFAFCATATSSMIIEIDGEVMVMSTGPPALGVLEMDEDQEAIELMYFIDEDAERSEIIATKITHNERSGLLRWFNYTNGSGAPLHRWICA